MPRAIWRGVPIAESPVTKIVEGNHYFPIESVKREVLVPSSTKTVCAWKGEARYYHIKVDGEINEDAAWYYPNPKPAAAEIAGYVAFWNGVQVEE